MSSRNRTPNGRPLEEHVTEILEQDRSVAQSRLNELAQTKSAKSIRNALYKIFQRGTGDVVRAAFYFMQLFEDRLRAEPGSTPRRSVKRRDGAVLNPPSCRITEDPVTACAEAPPEKSLWQILLGTVSELHIADDELASVKNAVDGIDRTPRGHAIALFNQEILPRILHGTLDRSFGQALVGAMAECGKITEDDADTLRRNID